MEEVGERSQARENIIVALASYRSYVEEDKAKNHTHRSSLMPQAKGTRVAQKGIPDWLQELYDPLDEMMQKKSGAVDSTVLRESQN